MNTKQIPAILALAAGFFTCIMSFVQGVDITVFAKRFIIVCIVFFVIGTVARILIEVNFQEFLNPEPETEDTEENDEAGEEDQEEYGEYTEELEEMKEPEEESF